MDTLDTSLKRTTIDAQNKLGSYVRDGITVDIEGARPERLHHYRRLVFNLIYSTLSTAYPISRKLIDSQWKELVNRFFSTYDCQNYQVWRMPKEFLNYVLEKEKDILKSLPYLNDLLLFEWVEIELYSEEDKKLKKFSKKGNWSENSIVLNPHHQILKLDYPVYTKEYSTMHNAKGVYYLLVLRDLTELKVRFLELSPLFGPAIMNVGKFEDNLLASLEAEASHFASFGRKELKAKSQKTIDLLIDKNLILGYSVPN